MAKIVGISSDSIVADKLIVGDDIIAIDGYELVDILDIHYAEARTRSVFSVMREGEKIEVVIEKGEYEPFGIDFGDSLEINPIRCKNKCKFCFVDQLPCGMRDTLYVKDDDYRLSFVSGNYVTLTNCGDCEIDRIIRLRLSPIYVSVHATDGDIKTLLIANKEGAKTFEKVRKLTSNGIDVHAQIVVCPEINDGAVLEKSIRDLRSLGDRLRSVACVPVGLTKYREKLYPLRVFTRDEARLAISQIEELNKEFGGDFVFASDEFYIIADEPLPKYEYYGDFEQIENGVGLVREFEYEFSSALELAKGSKKHLGLTMITGVGFAPILENILPAIKTKYPNYTVNIMPVVNEFFGHDITVSGLLTAGDIITQCKGLVAENVTIPSNMLREFTDCLLDGMTVRDLEAELNSEIHVSDGGDGLVTILDNLGRSTISKIFSKKGKKTR